MPRPRQPRRQFLSPTGTRSTPMRPMPLVADEADMVERIRDATSIRDEPELVSEGWLSSQDLGIKQRLADLEALRTIRPTLEPEDRLKDIQRRAKQGHVNMSRDLMIMGAEIKRARTGGRKVPGRILRRIEEAEAHLDGLT